jgi:DNA-binding transcriptional regulator GbsR (MarR family)
MTEYTESSEFLIPAIETFVLRWGDMGSQWGVNRSVAQIHALLYVSDKPLTAENIAALLGIARSNVSNSLRELVNWKLIKRVPQLGDRRDHYIAEVDLWEMVRRIAKGRKERELDPAAQALQECIEQASNDERISADTMKRLNDMQDFVHRVSRWYEQILALPINKVMALINMGDKIANLIGSSPKSSNNVKKN